MDGGCAHSAAAATPPSPCPARTHTPRKPLGVTCHTSVERQHCTRLARVVVARRVRAHTALCLSMCRTRSRSSSSSLVSARPSLQVHISLHACKVRNAATCKERPCAVLSRARARVWLCTHTRDTLSESETTSHDTPCGEEMHVCVYTRRGSLFHRHTQLARSNKRHTVCSHVGLSCTVLSVGCSTVPPSVKPNRGPLAPPRVLGVVSGVRRGGPHRARASPPSAGRARRKASIASGSVSAASRSASSLTPISSSARV